MGAYGAFEGGRVLVEHPGGEIRYGHSALTANLAQTDAISLFCVCVCVCVCMCVCARVYVYVHIYVYVYICTIMYVYACVALTWRLVSVAADFGDLRFLGLLALGDLATPRGVKVTG